MTERDKLAHRALFIVILGLFLIPTYAKAAPRLNFSDLQSGPATGNSDGVGSGAIVTIWGHRLGSSQGSSKVYIGNVEAPAIYYWKNADGNTPGGPSNLYEFHRMQEIAFAIPAEAASGDTSIRVVVDGETSNSLAFHVRSGSIYFIKSTGDDSSGNGSWSAPWKTIQETVAGTGKISAGDIVYSVGVGSSSDIRIGRDSFLVGTPSNPFALIAYPGTTVELYGDSYYCLRNWYGQNRHWIFSKFTMDTVYQAIALFGYSRVIGNSVTGPTINNGYSGWIGGNCTPTADYPVPNTENCSGHKIFGNEVFNFGKADGSVDAFHHLYYISNRSGIEAEGYEIGWNYHHDNPIYQGIHIYDQSPCGGWSGVISIHHNVVVNQGGNSININTNCTEQINVDVFDNLIITDTDYDLPNRSQPAAALSIDISGNSDGVFRVYNNTIFGYGTGMRLLETGVDFKNNIVVDNRDVDFAGYTAAPPSSHGSNIFFSTENAAMSLPSWATSQSSNRFADPLFTQPSNKLFLLNASSPALGSGDGSVISVNPYDFFGYTRSVESTDIGTMGANDSIALVRPNPPSNLSAN